MEPAKARTVGVLHQGVRSKERRAAYDAWKKNPVFHRTVKRGEQGVTAWLRAERDGVND